MLKRRLPITRIAKAAQNAAERVREKHAKKDFDEEQFTGRMLEAIENAIDEVDTKNFILEAKSGPIKGEKMRGILEPEAGLLETSETRHKIIWEGDGTTSRGPGSEEQKIGADFVGLLDIDIENYAVKKGFLAQAKKYKNNFDWGGLKTQCEKMLKITPDSFVFVYSQNKNVWIVPAHSALQYIKSNHGKKKDIFDLHGKNVGYFFKEHLKSFIGDTKINTTDASALLKITYECKIGRALYISAREDSYKSWGAKSNND